MAFDSKFDCLAEIEALRAGLKGVRNAYDLPNLVPIDAPPQVTKPSSRAVDERAICEEMERRLGVRATARKSLR